MARRSGNNTAEITPVEIRQGQVEFFILGKTPLIYNAMAEKTKKELLKPSGRKTAAQRATSLKHEPLQEYRNSVYRLKQDETGPTRLLAPSRWFKSALGEVAKRIPGATKAEIQQLLWIENDMTDCYGVPQIFMSVVRSADMNRTPDIRTRAIVPQWCCKITIRYVQPQLSVDAIARLLTAAGIMCGVGDWRQQKGAGNYGQFEVVNETNPQFRALVKSAGLKQQDAALKSPVAYDQETEEMLAWFDTQMERSEHRREAAE